MRLLLCLTLLLLLCNFRSTLAQNRKEVVVQLRNGYSVKGFILEQNAEKLVIETSDGLTFEYEASQVVSISNRESRSEGFRSKESSSRIGQKENDIFTKGKRILSAGVGAGPTYYLHTYYDVNRFIPVFASYNVAVLNSLFNPNSALGIGGYISYAGANNREFDYHYSLLIAGVRADIHYQFADKLDSYGGLLMGIDYSGKTRTSTNGFTGSLFFGSRYFLKENFGPCVEFGIGRFTYLNVGISFVI